MAAGGRTSLFERQWNEVDAIKNIYIDEFEEVPYPWKVDHPPCFILHLSNPDFESNFASIDVEFKLTPTYPDTIPEIKVTKKKAIQTNQALSIQENLLEKAKSLVGVEMIFELVEFAKELLTTAAKKKVSFHDEMVKRKKEQETKKSTSPLTQNQAETPESIELTKKIKEELEHKEKMIKLSKEKSIAEEISDLKIIRQLNFNPPIFLQVPDSDKPIKIEKINIGEPLLDSDLGGASYSGRTEDGLDIFLTCIRFEGAFYHTNHGHKKLNAFCKKIQELSKLKYSPLYCRIIGTCIISIAEKVSDLWIVTDPRDDITMAKLLDCSGTMSLKKSMLYLEGILQSINEIHSSNITHQDLNLTNILISTSMSNIIIVNPLVSMMLRNLHQTHPISLKFKIPDEINWRPPEIITRGGQAGKKADIWSSGCILLQMLFGSEFITKYDDPLDAIDSITSYIPSQVKELLLKMFAKEPADRFSAAEALTHMAFSPKSMGEYDRYNMILPMNSSPISKSFKMMTSETPKRPDRNLETSRYNADFEEIQFLGKGAFGEVIKVRNRIDGRFYAIKRIKLDPSNVEYNKKILREVTTLSRMHHDRVVRYYQAWIEGGFFDSANSLNTSQQQTTDTNSESSDWDTSTDYSFEGVSSRKLYSSDVIGSSASLSSIIQFHTGFTSEDEDISHINSNSNLQPSKKTFQLAPPSQNLYIQMEYCPNQTLKDIIDAGVDQKEAWRLFRQVVEGLCHVHSQGMIHRDLKPGNIFLDTNGDIKIGDFGLAVGEEGELSTIKSLDLKHKIQEDNLDSLTSGIGTPLYASPEQSKPGLRYNQKVDMYSLGIILLELLVPFSTGMERALVIKDARGSPIKLPEIFDKPEMSKASSILGNLLCHDPKVRFTSEELLRSDLLPAKVEDEYINEIIRSISAPNTPYFGKLLERLFTQAIDPLKDYTFEFNSGFANDPTYLTRLNDVSFLLEGIFCRHGGINFIPPLLLPKGNNNTFKSPYFMNSSGQIVELPSDLTRPFARFIARNGIFDMKRYIIAPTFRENITGGHPRQPLEASFDIIYSYPDGLIQELEILRIAFESINLNLAPHCASLLLRINHMDIFNAVITQSLIPEIKRKQLFDLLAAHGNSSWAKIKSLLISQVVLSPSSVESISRVSGFRDLDATTTLKKLDELLRNSKDYVESLKSLQLIIDCISCVGVKCRIVLDPLFIHKDFDAYSGMIFQLCLDERKKHDVLANGGSYKKLIDYYRVPSDIMRKVNGIGVTFSVNKLATLRSSFEVRSRKSQQALIYSTGPDLLKEKLSVATILWDAGIMTDIIREDVVTGEYISQISRIRGINLAVQLKDYSSHGQFGIVRLRNLEKRQELDIPRTELVEVIKQLFSDPEKELNHRTDTETASSTHAHSTLFAPLNVSLFAPYSKMKGSQKSIVMEKAVRAVAPILSSFSGPKPIEIIAHDLPKDLIRRLIDSLNESEDVFKKTLDGRDDREAAGKMRSLLKGMKEKRTYLFLYNYKEGYTELISLANL